MGPRRQAAPDKTSGADQAETATSSDGALQPTVTSQRTVTSHPEVPDAAAGRSVEAATLNDRCGRYFVLGLLGTGSMGIVLSAYDPVLARKVALKLLLPSQQPASTDGTSRLEAEAQAMAKLSHPNVVTVYEVDRVGNQMFVAMELVEGSTLRGWIRERPRGWREIVDMFVAAGRGLAAAHAAGLVHRDFKPDNVLIGRDGRPRVSDFGIVASVADRAAADVDAPGKVMGTPAYMPAEQWAGGVVDARSDQFAFSVALWEALWGSRPFSGTSSAELRAAIEAGVVAEPPGSPRVPRAVVNALRRGLACDPAARWPDLSSLLDALARAAGVRRRWAVAAIAAAAAVVSASAAVLIMGTGAGGEPPDPCPPPVARTAAVWSPARAATLRDKLAAIDPAQGALRAAKIATELDRGAQGWSAMYVETCRATQVEHRQSDTLLDRRMACLDRWLAELASTVDVVEQTATLAAVDHAAYAAAELSPLAVCADVRALSEALPLPTGARERATAQALGRRAQEIDVDQRAHRLDGITDKARELVAAARELGHPPTLAAALQVQVHVDYAIGRDAESEPTLRELAQVAARAHDDRMVVFAWTELIMTLASNLGKRDEALGLIPTANVAVLRAGDPEDLRVELLYVEGAILDEGPRPADGLAALTQARQLLAHMLAGSPSTLAARRLIDVVFETGTAQLNLGQVDAAIASYRDAIERWRALYGPDSPDEQFGWQNLGVTLSQADRKDEALAALRTGVRIAEARLGESPRLAYGLAAVASVLSDLGRWDEALASYDRALRIFDAQVEPDDLQRLETVLRRAIALAALDRLDEAARSYEVVIAAYEASDAKDPTLGLALDSRGDLSAKRGRCDAATRDYRRAAALFEQLRGPDAAELIFPLVGDARCLLRAGKRGDAIAQLERAVRLPHASDAFEAAVARGLLGRAEVETGRDVAGGLAMARQARAQIAASPRGAALARELDAWLEAHPADAARATDSR